MRHTLLKMVLVLCACVLVACPDSCENNSSPTGNSNVNGPTLEPSPTRASVSQWTGYLGIHAFAPHTGVQQEYLLPLIESGAVRGVRMEASPGGGHGAFIPWFQSHGVNDFLLIFPNEFLRQDDVWEQLRALMMAFPDVRYWEIGNEVSLFINMSAREYTPIFLDLHAKASREFPNQIVMPMAIFGASSAVPMLKGMLDAGLQERANDPEIPLRILPIHFYGYEGPFLRGVKQQLERVPNVEVWITETGSQYKPDQIRFTQVEIPRAQQFTRATRAYWYVFAECPFGTDRTDFSLVSGLPDQCNQRVETSPLYDALVGGR